MPRKPDHISQEDWDSVDSPELSEEMLKSMRPAREVLPPAFMKAWEEGRIGRPKAISPKKAVTIRLDAEVLAWLRASGKGWQTRLNGWLAERMHKGQ